MSLLCCLAWLASCGRPIATGVVQLNVLMEPDGSGVWHQLVREFHDQNPDITVNFIEGAAATNAREDAYVTSFFSGETIYDLVHADVVWVPKFAAAGWLDDLTDRWPRERWAQFIPAAIEGGSYAGRICRVPTQLDVGMLYYRRDLVGETPPRTFDALVQLARKHQRPDELWGFVWQGKQYEGLACVFVEALAGFGGTWIDAKTGAVGLDQPAAIAALDFLTRCVRETKISPPGVTTYSEEETRQIFGAGRAVFMRNWPYAFPLMQREGSPVRGKIGIAPMPANAGGKSGAALGGWGLCVAKTSAHKEACWRFIEFISALPQARRIHGATGLQPALKEFYERNSDPAQRAAYAVMQHAVARPPLPQYAQASDILQRYVSAALSGQMSARDALQRAAKETRLLLGK
ncbi:MAG TPA: ABC transporter substrate-binding protein [Chthoniobacteraceae bacterium]|nr:ABC transporter substrate-binding protein [Chthoniobacteraceae bacterium]